MVCALAMLLLVFYPLLTEFYLYCEANSYYLMQII